MVSWIRGFPTMLDRWRVRLGIRRRRTSSGCAVPHCASNSMVVQRTQSGKDTFNGVGQSVVNQNFRLWASITYNGKKNLTYPVLCNTGLFVRVVALNHWVVVRGGASGQALFWLVARCAVCWLVGVKSGRGIFLVEGRDSGQQLLNEDEDFNGSLGENKIYFYNSIISNRRHLNQ